MVVESILALGGLIVPPAFDFIKKKFIGSDDDTSEATMSALATTSPDTLPQYTSAVAEHLKAKVEWFNRDVVGTPSQWVIDLRASIRPAAVIIGFLMLGLEMGDALILDDAARAAIVLNNSSWFGSRLTK